MSVSFPSRPVSSTANVFSPEALMVSSPSPPNTIRRLPGSKLATGFPSLLIVTGLSSVMTRSTPPSPARNTCASSVPTPESSSVTVSVTTNRPPAPLLNVKTEALSPGRSSCVPDLGVPSSVTVHSKTKVSSVPGSSVTSPRTLIKSAVSSISSLRIATVGATLFTVTAVLAMSTPPSSSSTVTPMLYMKLGPPEGPSSRYV